MRRWGFYDEELDGRGGGRDLPRATSSKRQKSQTWKNGEGREEEGNSQANVIKIKVVLWIGRGEKSQAEEPV